MERCPVCRARFKEEPVCYRCGADLSALLAIEAEAAALEQRAIAWLEAGQPWAARRTAEQVLALPIQSAGGGGAGFRPSGTACRRDAAIGAVVAVSSPSPHFPGAGCR